MTKRRACRQFQRTGEYGMRGYIPLVCLALTHTLVDTSALVIAPLWPALEERFGLGVTTLSLAFIVQSLPTSLSQAVFGFLRDRRPAPVWLWAGPALGIVCMCLLGQVDNLPALFVLLIVGGVGIGAFHPEAAVRVGGMLPGHRTRSLAMFMFGGSLGLALGPLLSGQIVGRWGLPGLVYLMPCMLAALLLLSWVGNLSCWSTADGEPSIAPSSPQPKHSATIGQLLEGRTGFALQLLMVCSLRLVPNMGMNKVLAFALQRKGYDEAVIGQVQSLFLVAASAGMLVLALRFPRGWERVFMIACPLAGVPLLYGLSLEGNPMWVQLALLIPTGLVLWGTAPAMVSYAQQQFPRGAGVASALTMGVAWGVGGLIQAPLTSYFQAAGREPLHALRAFIPCLLIAGWGAWLLPETRGDHRPQDALAPAGGDGHSSKTD